MSFEIIQKYTDALYITSPEVMPTYNEFRDMFSAGQIKSKLWLVDELSQVLPAPPKSLAIAGAWYATLAFILKSRFPHLSVNCLDIDARCKKFVDLLLERSKDNFWLQYFTEDMYKYSFTEEVVVNTSCEHISNLPEWLRLLPASKLVVLQSTNYQQAEGHINCTSSTSNFIEQTSGQLKTILYSGELNLSIYSRYMIIGKT